MVGRTPSLTLVALLVLAGCVSVPDAEPADGEGPADPLPGPVAGVVEWAGLANAVLRPGAPMGGCTYNFLFVDPYGADEDGEPTYYIGTAAHCVRDVGVRTSLPGHGEIGEVAFSSFNQTFQDDHGVDRSVDFALIRLDAEMNLVAHPRMMNTNGPTGYATAADVALGDELQHHGYGMVFGSVEPLRDRPGWLVSFDKDYCSESVIWWGDSGSPVLHADTHYALGIVSRAGWTSCTPTSQLRGATLPFILEELAKTEFRNVRLALADGSYTDPWDP